MKPHVQDIFQSLMRGLSSEPLCYLSTPITSGLREFEVMEGAGAASVRELKERFPEVWRKEVLQENEDRARQCEQELWKNMPGYQILNPANTSEDGWTQNCYDDLWAEVIRQNRPVIGLAPHWAYSRGARKEIALALTLGLDFVDTAGNAVSSPSVVLAWRRADEDMRAKGWDAALPTRLPTLPATIAMHALR